MLLACVAEFDPPRALCHIDSVEKGGREWPCAAEGRQRAPGVCLDRALAAGPSGPPHGLYPLCRGANQQPGLLLPHPSEVRCRQKLLWVPWPVVLPQGNC